MVESELFPALRYFGLRFYAYNPVSHLDYVHVSLQKSICYFDNCICHQI